MSFHFWYSSKKNWYENEMASSKLSNPDKLRNQYINICCFSFKTYGYHFFPHSHIIDYTYNLLAHSWVQFSIGAFNGGPRNLLSHKTM